MVAFLIMNNNVSEHQTKDRILKSLAVGGFVGLIIVIAWLSIKMVAYLPNAFSSLASLADSVYNYKPTTIIAVSGESIVNVQEPFTVSWNVPTQKGTFAFSHSCVEGVAIDIRTSDGSIKNLTCATNYNVGSGDSIEVIAQSEKERFVDVLYIIDFIPTRSAVPTASSTGMITVVNASISPIATSTPESPTPEPEVPVVTPTPIPVVPSPTPEPTPIPVPKPTPKPEYIQEYIYQIPVSNPNGTVDLSARFISTGNLSNTGQYSAVGAIDNDAIGAIQFEVKNIGTKTSNTWNFIAKLPNGDTFTSETQAALKPNERAVLTVGFTAPNITGTKTINVAVTVRNDSKLTNNSFTTAVVVKD